MSEPNVALVVAPPRGLEVRVERDTRDDGPFRSLAVTRTVIGLRAPRGWHRPVVGTDWIRPLIPVGAGIVAIMVAGLSTGLQIAMIGITGNILIDLVRNLRGRRRELLSIETESLVVAGLPRIHLAEIESVDVGSRLVKVPLGKLTLHEYTVHDVIVTTPAGKLLAATTPTADQARHVRDLIDAARREGG